MKLKCIINLNCADERKGQSPQPGRGCVGGRSLNSAWAAFGRAGPPPPPPPRTCTPRTRYPRPLPAPSPKRRPLGRLPCASQGPVPLRREEGLLGSAAWGLLRPHPALTPPSAGTGVRATQADVRAAGRGAPGQDGGRGRCPVRRPRGPRPLQSPAEGPGSHFQPPAGPQAPPSSLGHRVGAPL